MAKQAKAMFSTEYPWIFSNLGQLAYGFQPVEHQLEGRYSLLVKVPKEAILTARIKKEIRIYPIPDSEAEGRFLGFITAFFDDHDKPLVLYSPLYSRDEMLIDLVAALSQASVCLYFFDELDREIMGFRAALQDQSRFRELLLSATFRDFDLDGVPQVWDAMANWFAWRTEDDDASAFTFRLIAPLYAEDVATTGPPVDADNFHGAGTTGSNLEREEPGPFQESDIARQFQRVFAGDAIYLNPTRTDSGTELTDILCLGENSLLLVQAKDSPNSKAALDRSIDRKRAVIRKHIQKAANQLRGAVSYVAARQELVLRTSSNEHTLGTQGRQVYGIVVVRELFDDDYGFCSEPVLRVVADTGAACVLLDYRTLHELTLHRGSEASFVEAINKVFETAMEHGEYPKSRFIGPLSDQGE